MSAFGDLALVEKLLALVNLLRKEPENCSSGSSRPVQAKAPAHGLNSTDAVEAEDEGQPTSSELGTDLLRFARE